MALLMMLTSLACAQTPEAREAADQAVQNWAKGQYALSLKDVQNSRETVLHFLRFQQSVPVDQIDPKKGRFLVAQNGTETYAYPFEGQVQGTALVEVAPEGTGWEARSVRTSLQNVGIPSGLKSPVFTWLFALLSVVVLLGVLLPTPLRRGFVHAWKVALSKPYRAWFWGSQIVLYGSFVLGMNVAYQDQELARELQAYIGSTLSSTGIQQFLGQGVLTLATGITVWNFFSGAFLTTFLPGLFLGFPAVIFNVFRFVVLGIGLSPALIPASNFIPHIPVMVLELQAYIFVASFAVVTVIRMFREGFGKAIRDYPLSLLVALFFLLLGNWYEAFELLYLVPKG